MKVGVVRDDNWPVQRVRKNLLPWPLFRHGEIRHRRACPCCWNLPDWHRPTPDRATVGRHEQRLTLPTAVHDPDILFLTSRPPD
jgi:hypothetical protein